MSLGTERRLLLVISIVCVQSTRQRFVGKGLVEQQFERPRKRRKMRK